MKLVALTVCMAVAVISGGQRSDECIPQGTSNLWRDFVNARRSGAEPILPDFSYAGYHYSNRAIPDVKGPVFHVTDYGATPNDGTYDDSGIQKAIDAASQKGGVVLFPAGQFLVSPTND